jgi:serine/threonine-protein kinase
VTVTPRLRDPASAPSADTIDPLARTPLWAPLEAAPEVGEPTLQEPGAGAFRYRVIELLGEGGMGQVHLCHDGVVGREVAVKTMLPELESQPSVRSRFLREARVQGQLEHPGVVPVHEIGVSPEGPTYFTMKRIRGVTLASVIAALAEGEPEAEARFSLRRLLAAFVSVCLTVDFAHERGVLHRDLKPGNVMLGDHGEVSVLDWGLAKPDAEPASADPGAPPRVDDASLGPLPDEAQTELGALLGTPGYMAPEQVLGGPATVQGDVFALGAILFEILAREPLFPRLTMRGILSATLKGADARISSRCPARNVPPELEAICLRATATSPRDRHAGARELSEAVEKFLEGDRDLIRRKELAQARADEAAALLQGAPLGGAAYEDARSRAMRALGHALALDPDNAAARASLVRILTEPPSEAPPEVREAIQADAEKQVSMGAAMGARLLLTWLPFVAVFWWLGVRDLRVGAAVLVPICVGAALGFHEARRPVVRPWSELVTIACTIFAMAATSRVFGPFVLVPVLAGIYAVNLQMHPRVVPRRVALVLCSLAMIVPMLFEHTGVLPRTVTFQEGAIVLHTGASLRGGWSLFVFTAIAMTTTLAGCAVVGQMREALNAAERRLHLQAWHVQRMMPEGLPTRTEPGRSPLRRSGESG